MKIRIILIAILFPIYTFSQIIFQDCSDLFFSEYLEGWGNDKGFEIYNPTSDTIYLQNYAVKRYGNGSPTETESFPLSGFIAPYDVIVACNGQTDSIDMGTWWSPAVSPNLHAIGDLHDVLYPAVCYFNGDDAITLERSGVAGWDILDCIGKIGEDPGYGWTDDASAGFTDANGGAIWTQNNILIRKSNIKHGSIQSVVFNVTLEWDSLSANDWTNLGSHTCDCAPVSSIHKTENDFKIYPNPVLNTDVMVIQSSDVIENLTIINSNGQIMQRIKPNNNVIFLNVKNYKKGSYHVISKTKNDNFNKLMIVD